MLIPWRSLVLISFTSLAVPLIPAQTAEDRRHTTFLFDGFNGTNLILEADASVIGSESVLALTNHSHEFMLGRALYGAPVHMKSNHTVSSFSTTFVFSIVPPPANERGHGLAFIMTPYTSPMGAQPVQYLGLLNLTSNGQPYNHLFAVEFDTIMNVEFKDPERNHVGVDINSLISVQTETARYWNGEEFHELNLRSGRNIQTWIDYDHLQSRFNVTITVAGFPRPQRPLISLQIDLQNILEEKMFVGFSASTGLLVEDHYILAWSFTTQGTAPLLDVSCLPSFANMYSEPLSWGFIAGVTVVSVLLFSLVIAGAMVLRRTINRETIEEWEQEYWPHRFAYKELSIATRGFREENLLGYGGFGMVYKGVLPSSGQEVAVILKGVAAGLLYLHEQWEKRVVHRDIKSSNVLLDSEFNGRLSDFGLARLYDHSENPETTHVVGTLGYIAPELIQTGKATPRSDVFSFGVLLLEVACGKSPVDSLEESERMILVEWAWKLYAEGRLLEASDPKLAARGGYDEGEMEKVLKLGLLCSQPEPESRLGMRQVCQILNGEAPIPRGC